MHAGECERCGEHFEKKWKSRFCSRSQRDHAKLHQWMKREGL